MLDRTNSKAPTCLLRPNNPARLVDFDLKENLVALLDADGMRSPFFLSNSKVAFPYSICARTRKSTALFHRHKLWKDLKQERQAVLD
jgi:hypothetical protein